MLIVRVPNPSDFNSYPPNSGSQPPQPQFVQIRPVVGDGQQYRPESRWKKMLGPLAGVGILIAKFFAQLKFLILPILKFLPVILKTGGSMLLTMGVYAALYGWKWAVGVVLLIFVHECGHLVVARFYGLKVTAPMFIPFMGAFILLKDRMQNAWVEAWVGIGGPLLGAAGALACHVAGLVLDSPLLISLAYFGYFINLFNLTPVGQLDGGHITAAISPWLWIPGLFILVGFAVFRPSLIVFILLAASIPQVIGLFRNRTMERQRYYEVTGAQRGTMAAMYFGLVALLLLGMYESELMLQEGTHRRTPTSVAADFRDDKPADGAASQRALD